MLNIELLKKTLETIENAHNIAIVPSKVAGLDGYAAGVGLYHLLKAKEKQVELIYQGKIPEGAESLLDSKNVVSNITERELILSVDYSDNPHAQAQYSIDKGVLMVKIKPVRKDFDVSKIKVHLSNTNYDVIITVGAQFLEDFGQTFREMEIEFYTSKLVNIDNTERNSRFGNYNLVETQADSLSLLALNLGQKWELDLSKDAAKAFLSGVTSREPKV